MIVVVPSSVLFPQVEMDRVRRQLKARVREPAERYNILLPTLTDRVAELEAKVHSHLERMGFSWK